MLNIPVFFCRFRFSAITVLSFALITYHLSLTASHAEWIIWQSRPSAPAPERETISDPAQILKNFPLTAAKKGLVLKLDILLLGGQDRLRILLEEAGWRESASRLTESLGGVLLEILSGKKPSMFPPVSACGLEGRSQDMSFISDGSKLRIWRLPFSTVKGLAAWAGSVETHSRAAPRNRKAGGKPEAGLKMLHESLKKSKGRFKPEIRLASAGKKSGNQKRGGKQASVLMILLKD
ncbi:MAG: LssY C-terminal domain-containing protein [bacterium]